MSPFATRGILRSGILRVTSHPNKCPSLSLCPPVVPQQPVLSVLLFERRRGTVFEEGPNGPRSPLISSLFDLTTTSLFPSGHIRGGVEGGGYLPFALTTVKET